MRGFVGKDGNILQKQEWKKKGCVRAEGGMGCELPRAAIPLAVRVKIRKMLRLTLTASE